MASINSSSKMLGMKMRGVVDHCFVVPATSEARTTGTKATMLLNLGETTIEDKISKNSPFWIF